MLPLLADLARSECARLGKERVSARSGGRVRRMRAVGSTCARSTRTESDAQLAKDRYTDLLKWRKEEHL